MTELPHDSTPTPEFTVGAAPPPPVPRVVTPHVSRRAWTEPSVRVWWLIALSIFIVFLVYVVDRLWEREIDRRLIRDGAVVQAKMMGTADKYITGQKFSPGDIVNVQFSYNGQDFNVPGPIHDTMAVGQMFPIHVDKESPAVWTDLNDTAPLLASMFVGFLFLPFAPLALAVAIIKQRALKSQWETGEPAAAIVQDRRQTPVAPLSYAIRCSLRDHRNKQLFTVYVPSSGATLEPENVIWVINSNLQSRPVAAMWFE